MQVLCSAAESLSLWSLMQRSAPPLHCTAAERRLSAFAARARSIAEPDGPFEWTLGHCTELEPPSLCADCTAHVAARIRSNRTAHRANAAKNMATSRIAYTMNQPGNSDIRTFNIHAKDRSADDTSLVAPKLPYKGR